jgi:hypothetical protein
MLMIGKAQRWLLRTHSWGILQADESPWPVPSLSVLSPVEVSFPIVWLVFCPQSKTRRFLGRNSPQPFNFLHMH